MIAPSCYPTAVLPMNSGLSYRLSEHTPPALCWAVLSAIDTSSLLVCLDLRYLGHLRCCTTMIAGVLAVGQRSWTHATQTCRIVVTERIVARASRIKMLVVAVSCAAATAVFVGLRRVICRCVRVRAAWWLMQTKLLLLVVGLIADPR